MFTFKAKLLLAAPMPLSVHKAETYYHGIANCDDTLAHKILAEGLTIDPKRGKRWGGDLIPQEAVYLTINLDMALGYAMGSAYPLTGHGEREAIKSPLYVAEVSGQNLKANIEIDEDHLFDMLTSGDYDYLKPESIKWFDDYLNKLKDEAEIGSLRTRADEKQMINAMPSSVAYDILDQFPNIAHYANTRVDRIYKWSGEGGAYLKTLMQSCDKNKPIGAEVM